jgi:hypothetical protein
MELATHQTGIVMRAWICNFVRALVPSPHLPFSSVWRRPFQIPWPPLPSELELSVCTCATRKEPERVTQAQVPGGKPPTHPPSYRVHAPGQGESILQSVTPET